MKYALIGCGRISPNHIEAAKNNNLDFVAMCDILPKAMKEKADKFGLKSVKQYTDYKEMLAVEKPDLVGIATESGKHAAIALDCIAAGCSLIIEKPIALSIADADAIIKAGKEAGVVVCANHQNRFNKSVQKIREALEKGRFGRMFYGTAHIRWCRDWEYYSRADWRGVPRSIPMSFDITILPASSCLMAFSILWIWNDFPSHPYCFILSLLLYTISRGF